MSREYILVPKTKYESLLKRSNQSISSQSVQQGGRNDHATDSDQAAHADKLSISTPSEEVHQQQQQQLEHQNMQTDTNIVNNSLTEDIPSTPTGKLCNKRPLSKMDFLFKR